MLVYFILETELSTLLAEYRDAAIRYAAEFLHIGLGAVIGQNRNTPDLEANPKTHISSMFTQVDACKTTAMRTKLTFAMIVWLSGIERQWLDKHLPMKANHAAEIPASDADTCSN